MSSRTISLPLRLIACASSSTAILMLAVPGCDTADRDDQANSHLEPAHQPGPGELDSWEQKHEYSVDRLKADFNNDGFADLVIGVPNEDLSGAFIVLYGSEDGLTTDGNQMGLGSSPGEMFASAFAAGDFNDDGFADLVIGSPSGDVNAQTAAGYITVLFGSEDGLTANGSQIWHQDVEDIEPIEDAAEANDNFGASLITGDFDSDGIDDLAIGVPGEDIGATTDAGAVHVLFGSMDGLVALDEQFLHQGVVELSESAEPNDRFGTSLSAGYLNGDDFEDLVIGVPGENTSAGLVHALYGESAGLVVSGPINDAPAPQVWRQGLGGIENSHEAGDEFGSATTIGDFNGDGVDDLAVGVPGEDIGSDDDAGAVSLIYGADTGLTATGDQYWNQDSAGILESAEDGDRFGEALAAGDLNADGYDDLAVGTPSEDIANAADAGAVNVLYGAETGLSATGDQLWHQNTAGIEGVINALDYFASALTTGDFDGDDDADLAIGIPFENIGAATDAGAVAVIHGDVFDGLTNDDQLWHEDSTGVPEVAEPGDNFGAAVR